MAIFEIETIPTPNNIMVVERYQKIQELIEELYDLWPYGLDNIQINFNDYTSKDNVIDDFQQEINRYAKKELEMYNLGMPLIDHNKVSSKDMAAARAAFKRRKIDNRLKNK